MAATEMPTHRRGDAMSKTKNFADVIPHEVIYFQGRTNRFVRPQVISHKDWTSTHSVVPFRPKPDAREAVYRDWFNFLQLSVVTPVYPAAQFERACTFPQCYAPCKHCDGGLLT